MTVRVTGTLVLPPPDDAVTVTFDVPAGVPVGGGLPPELVVGGGDDESLPLQLNRPTNVRVAMKPTMPLNSRRFESRRRRSMPTGNRAIGVSSHANIVGGIFGARRATAPPLVPIVNVVLTGPPAGVTVGGLKEQLAPTGRPPQLKLTG